MHRGTGRYGLALALAIVAPPAHADPSTPATAPSPPPPLQVEYSAPGNCPTEADFEARVRSRTALARFADDRNAQAVHVVVTPTGVTYAGHLSIVGRSGRVSERDVEDALCSDVVDALALVTALAVDPNAMLSPSAPPAAASAVAPGPPLDAAGPDAATIIPLIAPAPVSTNPLPPVSPPTRPDRPPDRAESSASSARAWIVDLGASFVTLGGIAPDTLAGGGGFGEIASASPRWLAPSARVTIFAAENGVFESRTASFLLVGGRVDVCPLRIGSRDVSLRPCAGADIGAVRAEGIDAAAGHGVPGTEAWLDFAAFVRARWAPGRGRFFVEAEGGIFVPVNRSSFVYTHVATPIDTPWLAGAEGSLAVGVALW